MADEIEVHRRRAKRDPTEVLAHQPVTIDDVRNVVRSEVAVDVVRLRQAKSAGNVGRI